MSWYEDYEESELVDSSGEAIIKPTFNYRFNSSREGYEFREARRCLNNTEAYKVYKFICNQSKQKGYEYRSYLFHKRVLTEYLQMISAAKGLSDNNSILGRLIDYYKRIDSFDHFINWYNTNNGNLFLGKKERKIKGITYLSPL